MTAAGYRARLECVEWMGRLWLQNGTPFDLCEAMVSHCSECVEADYYGTDRPQVERWSWPGIMEAYFDKLFASSGNVVSFD